MITDLFSHKIHSSSTDWPDKLVEIACVFSDLDGQVYDRNNVVQILQELSPRSAYTARDPSKFRDEISAYPAYLGLYRLEQSRRGWILRLSDTARAFLVTEEPDVASFLRLQLLLFQYPNGMGCAYYSGTNNLRIQANARDRTLELINNGVHLSPLRLICQILRISAEAAHVPLWETQTNYGEIFALANLPSVNHQACPDPDVVQAALDLARQGGIRPPDGYEKRFHILEHTDLFTITRGRNATIRFRTPVDDYDASDLQHKIETITETNIQFEGFDHATNGKDITDVVASGLWGEYFDGLRVLSGACVNALTEDRITQGIPPTVPITEPIQAYPLKPREDRPPPPPSGGRSRELADPEVTKIKRQRRNLMHKILVEQMENFVRNRGGEAFESVHIDLFAQIPDDGSFLFEIKSGGENFLDQIRKGISQLYEYRYRYKEVLPPDVILCLVTGTEPAEPVWLVDYLVQDRDICICWFDQEGLLNYPTMCEGYLDQLVNF